MRLATLYFCISLALCQQPWPAKIEFFDQKITHFNFVPNEPTFKNRYVYEDKWYEPGGPIFFYCGNEGDILGFWNNTGFMFEIAPNFHAFVIFVEHRYYGESLPFYPLSFSQPFIQFLSMEEALADFADIIQYLPARFNLSNSPVVTFGGSYGGMLSAYMRLKYPHLIQGAISASSPFKWVSGEEPMHAFFETIKEDYFSVNASCVPVIQSAYDVISKLAAKGSSGLKQISDTLRLCKPLQDQSDVDWMLRWSRNAFVLIAMMDYPYVTDFLGPMPAFPVNVSCSRAAAENDPLAGLREAIGVAYNASSVSCFDYKTQYIDCADITGCGLGNDSIAWDFQSCTEMHLYDPSNATANDMFPSLPKTLADVNAHCLQKYGVKLAENQLRTVFGLSSIWKSASNIVFSNGNRDPWMKGGILENPSKNIITITIQGGAHHLDLRSSNKQDPPEVVTARQTEITQITKWLKEFEENHF